MTAKERDKLDSIIESIRILNNRSERVERGMYGDPGNQFKGLIERQEDDEKNTNKIDDRVVNLERINKNISKGFKIVGSVGASGGAIIAFWDSILKLFK